MDERVAELLDKQEITEALYRYCRGFDRLDADLVRSAYHSDGVDDHGHTVADRDSFVSGMIAHLRDTYDTTTHTIGNILIELAGDVAHVESSCIAAHTRTTAGRTWIDTVTSRYVDRFTRRDGAWRIARRTVVVDTWHSDERRPWRLQNDVSTMNRGRRDRDDPTYRTVT